jgi:hypothetical protein
MKSIRFFFRLILVCALSLSAQNKLNKLGLIAELSYVKLTAENHMIANLNDTTLVSSERKDLIRKYLSLKTMYDQILLQLISDGVKRNRIKTFKKLDKALYQKEISEITEGAYCRKVRSYLSSLKKANDAFDTFIRTIPKTKSDTTVALVDESESAKSRAASLEDIIGILEFASSTIVAIGEARGKKVEAINKLLDSLRLSPIDALGKAKKVEEEKKEEDKGGK